MSTDTILAVLWVVLIILMIVLAAGAILFARAGYRDTRRPVVNVRVSLRNDMNPDLLKLWARQEFEADAEAIGFDLTRDVTEGSESFDAPEPWFEYLSSSTGNRWAGYLACYMRDHN